MSTRCLVLAGEWLVLLCLAANAYCAEIPACTVFRFGDEISVEGRMVKRTFAGPPNYKSIRHGDVPETAWVLKLDNPVCVYPVQADRENEAANDIGQLQLVFMERRQLREAHRLIARHVVATGKFFSAHSGHHHTSILLEIVDIRMTRQNNPTHCSSVPPLCGVR